MLEPQELGTKKPAEEAGNFCFKTIVIGNVITEFSRAGHDLLSRALRRSTIGATAFHARVRDGISCFNRAKITSSTKLSYNEIING